MNAKASSPDLEALEEFTKRTSRQKALFFVGRDRELADIEDACALAFSEAMAGNLPAGQTRIVQGAPGAGKTSLLLRLAEIWEMDDAAARPVLLDRKTLDSEEVLAEKIVEVLDPKKLPEFRRTVTRRLHADARVFGVGGGADSATATAPPGPSLGLVAEMFPLHEWQRPLCLMFDEMQNATRSQVDALEPLHLGINRLPVVPVLAGIGNTSEVLGRHGMSHIDEACIHTLGALAFDDAAEAVERHLDGFRVDRRGAEVAWPAELAASSDGWPRHLHNGLQALASGLLAVCGRLVDVDACRVRTDARNRRLRSYWGRVSPEMRLAKGLVRELMKSLPDQGLEDAGVLAAMNALTRTQRPDEGLPEGFTVTRFLDHLIAKGVLQSDGAGKLICPIPSFQDFMAHGFAMAPGTVPRVSPRLWG